ncbi:zinc finger protein 11-like [Eurosta solidaginis]|uniref:zinc finger protein 11-like n=1 Tax=Eurosta solidaginis TaxID=178769 RepID=UPI0035314DE1
MAQDIKKPEIYCSNFRKCGEILTSFQNYSNTFYLNCEFCECTFLELHNFIQHMFDQHLAQMPGSLIKQEGTEESLNCFEEVLDCYDVVNIAEETAEKDLLKLTARKEITDTHLDTNNFETVLLSLDDEDIKEEFQQSLNKEDMHVNQTEIHNDGDVTTDDEMIPNSVVSEDANQTEKHDDYDVTTDDEMLPNSVVSEVAYQPEIHNDIDVTTDDEMVPNSVVSQEQPNLRRKKVQKNNHMEANDVDKTKMIAAAIVKNPSDSKPSSRYVKVTDSIIDVSQRIILAEIYKEHTCLWDEKDIAYRFGNRRDDALKSVRREFNNKTKLELTENNFLREVLYLRKICSIEKKKKVMCMQKNIDYKPSCPYYNYIKYLESDVAPYVCSICGDQHRGRSKLKVHEATHDGSLPFKCHLCERGFQLAGHLTNHLRRHAQDLPFNCEVCNKAFITSSEVVLHMRTHTGERPFVCYLCGAAKKSSSSLIDHIMRHKKDKRFKCEICSKAYYSSAKLKMHIKTHSKVCEYICDVCDKGFKTRKHLTQHRLIHASVKRYLCKICGKRFAQYAGLSCHMKSHGTTLTTKSIDIDLNKFYICTFFTYYILHPHEIILIMMAAPTPEVHVIECSDLKKCGEITAKITLKEKEYFLNCEFCDYSFLQIENFMRHICDDHLSEFSHINKELSEDEIERTVEDIETFEANMVVEKIEDDDLESLLSCKESGNYNFETVLLAPNETEIKGEFLQTKKEEYVHIEKKEIHNDNDDDMVSDLETEQSQHIEKKEIHNDNDDDMVSDLETEQSQTNSSTEEIAVDRKRKVPDEHQKKSKPKAANIKISDAIIDDSQCIILAKIYKKHRCLWDENDITYRFTNRRSDALGSACKEFNNKTGLNLTTYEFEREVLRIRKICTYEKKQKIMCKQNNLPYKESCMYYDHIKFLEVDVLPFVCSICEDQHRSLGALKIHEATHDGSLPFKCQICGRGFQLGLYLTQHLRRHAQDHRFNCEVCNKAFITSTELILHMRTHTGERPFICYVCGAKFVTSSGLIDHTMRHENNRRFKCDICSKGFCAPSMLKEHIKTHKKVRDHICEICEKGFKCRKNLVQHSRIHDSVKRYACKICGKRFAQAAGLSGHMKQHGRLQIS